MSHVCDTVSLAPCRFQHPRPRSRTDASRTDSAALPGMLRAQRTPGCSRRKGRGGTPAARPGSRRWPPPTAACPPAPLPCATRRLAAHAHTGPSLPRSAAMLEPGSGTVSRQQPGSGSKLHYQEHARHSAKLKQSSAAAPTAPEDEAAAGDAAAAPVAEHAAH